LRAEGHIEQPDYARLAESLACLQGQAEARMRALEDGPVAFPHPPGDSPDSIADGYALALTLEVDRLRLERELTRLAQVGDTAFAADLQGLTMLLIRVQATAERLRDALRAAHRGHEPRLEAGPVVPVIERWAGGGSAA